MNRKELYLKTVDLLLDAYNTGKLSHGDCTACAVGNICGNNSLWSYMFVTNGERQYKEKPGFVKVRSAKTGIIEVPEEQLQQYLNAGFVFDCHRYDDGWDANVSPPTYLTNKKQGIDLIESTGYTIDELAKVEYVFESSIANTQEGYDYYKKTNPKKGQFIGLSAVLDVLAEIHEINKDSEEEALLKEGKQTKLEGIYNTLCA